MHKISIAFAVIAMLAGVAAASEQTDVMAPVTQFVEGFNKGDVKTALGACANQTSIIDEFSPYEWHGEAACSAWASDYDADAKKNGITDGLVTLGTPTHIDVTSDRAYVVVPASYSFKQNGKSVKETDSTLTVALRKTSGSWHIIAWAWSKH